MTLGAALPLAAADRIILRNLDVLTDRTVRSFDEDGVVLDNDRRLGWDEIEKASLSAKQAEFDTMLQQLGPHLYRVRQRLSVGDYAGVVRDAEAVFPRYVSRRSPTAAVVFQGLMWGRLAVGRREEALEPYLLALECHRQLPAEQLRSAMPGDRRLRWDAKSGLCDELPPVWFDAEAAAAAMPGVGRAIGSMKRPWPPAVRIYYASLALMAGDRTRAETALADLDQKLPNTAQLALILQVQRDVTFSPSDAAQQPSVTKLQQDAAQYHGLNRAMALYWLGRATMSGETSSEKQQAALQLLRLPALFGEQYPELAAAGLYHAMQVLNELDDTAGSSAVRNELLTNFGQTYHATQLRQPSPTANTP